MNWINIKDQKPKHHQKVFVTVIDKWGNQVVGVAIWTDWSESFEADDSAYDITSHDDSGMEVSLDGTVTHWCAVELPRRITMNKKEIRKAEDVYKIYHENAELEYTLRAKTDLEAKREATEDMSFGGGTITISKNGVDIAQREFWQDINRFGWNDWKNI